MTKWMTTAALAMALFSAGEARAEIADGCHEDFAEFQRDVATEISPSEDKHIAMGQAVSALQRCRAGDADAFDRL